VPTPSSSSKRARRAMKECGLVSLSDDVKDKQVFAPKYQSEFQLCLNFPLLGGTFGTKSA
jgi:predicted transcriptional regulator